MMNHHGETEAHVAHNPESDAEERRQSYRAIFELLHKHDTKISVMETHALTVTREVAELTASMHLLRREIPDLMAKGLMQAVSNPELWNAAGRAMHAHAREAAGGWLFGGLKAAAVRASWVAALAFCLYAVGGPSAVIAWFKATHP